MSGQGSGRLPDRRERVPSQSRWTAATSTVSHQSRSGYVLNAPSPFQWTTLFPLFPPLTTTAVEMLQVRQEPNCESGGGVDTHFRLRIGSIFVILVGATAGALFPVLAWRSKRLNIPPYFFEFVHSFFRRLVRTADRAQVYEVFWIRCYRELRPHPLIDVP